MCSFPNLPEYCQISPENSMESSPKQRNSILIVEDNPNNIGVLFNLLIEKGFQVRVARDGESCLDKVNYDAPDLILLDVMMPGMDGFETCARLKANPTWAEIPVIFMTALSETVDKLRGLQLGAVDYITKPFEQQEILARVQLHLQLYNLTQRLKKEIGDRKAAQTALKQLNQDLEQRITERTTTLEKTVLDLQNAHRALLAREQQLQHNALHDSLTGLPNRTWLLTRLSQLIKTTQHHPQHCYAILFIDLDRFKVLNDSLGHLVGDELLKQVAQRLQTCLPDNATLVRWGGDEFIVLLEPIDSEEDAIAIAATILDRITIPFQLRSYQIHTGASIGITSSIHRYQQPQAVLRDADVAMYHAKHAGRGCYVVLTPEMQRLALSRLQLENELREGLARQEFVLHYQPIVSLSTGKLYGFEALIRWYHPKRGLVSPIKFIPIAEETGLIHDLGEWVLQEAIQQLQQWHRQSPQSQGLMMSINLSPLQLMQENLVEKIEFLLRKAQIKGEQIKLEVTESCLLEARSSETQVLERIKALGMQICIDDFGTGYSAFSRLHEFPVDTLKIDKSFIRRLRQDQRSGPTIQTIITLAHGLQMDAIAEGIETPEERQKLQDMGCEWGQGYLFATPLDSSQASEWIFND
ncbi:EAL domain-containing protein [Spirulina sp. CS-785/01]|uniref:two-component system response regulator n=1 Tax=Spirulina sp. CS-785/01 TaxID=3021716 RepID=UPI00232BAAA9|nr:EAL domain-containing protein [Spirulina sp. CS-785/01]MDB9314675.1 EAL domain-containing protein [Spirulina sp. CS-785/01]